MCSQEGRKFRLADCASDALAHALAEIQQQHTGINRFENVRVECVPEAAPYTLGYFRFGGNRDIRRQLTNADNPENLAIVNPSKL